ncbi:MAG: hypothetical protein KAI67_05950 [Candidatus Pacebacteria bacterium]|nr:hypothetical protein [Candidatus Paceibacterota bacterium]
MTKNISEVGETFVENYKNAIKLEESYNETADERIKLHQVSSKIAFLYEKLRNAIDYKEEHLLRKTAIERILKRRLTTEKNELDVAKFLIYELIRARYLQNDKIPEIRIFEVKQIIEKYTLFINNFPEQKNEKGDNSDYLFDWTVGIAACEIEEKIAPYKREDAIVEFAKDVIDKKLKVPEQIINEENRKNQIYIALLRNLTKSDVPLIRYRLFEMNHPEWFFAPSEGLIMKMSKDISSIISDIEEQANNPLGEHFSRFIKKNLAYFTILEDVITRNTGNINKIFVHHLHIEDAIKDACIKKYKEAKIKLKRAATRSIIYIFITKVGLAIAMELPFDKYIIGHINYFALGVNIIFPPLLMLLVVVTIKIPSKKNTEAIVKGIMEMIHDEYHDNPFIMKDTLHSSSFFNKAFKFFYAFVFIGSFGIIILILQKFNFNVMSIGLFLFFLSVVSYFGVRIRQSARELVVLKRKEGIITFATDLFSIPILRVGQWFSTKLSNINIFAFILDFIIEAPFKTFVEVFEEWINYIKEERDKIY